MPVEASRSSRHGSRRGRLVALLLLVVLVVLGALAAATTVPPAAATDVDPPTVRYRAPVPGPPRLVRPFTAPAQPWAPGHRGIDLALDEGEGVLAPGPGTVTVAGTIVDRGVVVIAHPDGLRSTLEPVAAAVVVGQWVDAGDVVGTLTAERPHCARACLHWGVREGTSYRDPLVLLPGGGPVVLLPWTG